MNNPNANVPDSTSVKLEIESLINAINAENEQGYTENPRRLQSRDIANKDSRTKKSRVTEKMNTNDLSSESDEDKWENDPVLKKRSQRSKNRKNYILSSSEDELPLDINPKCRRASGKMFKEVKQKARLYCRYCLDDASMDDVSNLFKKPSCNQCSENLIFICKACYSQCSTIKNMFEHLTRACIFTFQNTNCHRCGQKFKSKKNLSTHQRYQCSIQNDNGILTYTCKPCDKKFKNAMSLKRHKDVCKNGFHCYLCGYSAKWKGSIIKHMKQAHN